MRVSSVIGEELLVNKDFRKEVEAYIKARSGVESLGLDDITDLKTVPVHVTTTPPKGGKWIELGRDEVIQEGDEWAPFDKPDRWRAVGASVGKKVCHFKNSKFRRQEIFTGALKQDGGLSLVSVECYVWDAKFSAERIKTVVRFNGENEYPYKTADASYLHARPVSLGVI